MVFSLIVFDLFLFLFLLYLNIWLVLIELRIHFRLILFDHHSLQLIDFNEKQKKNWIQIVRNYNSFVLFGISIPFQLLLICMSLNVESISIARYTAMYDWCFSRWSMTCRDWLIEVGWLIRSKEHHTQRMTDL